MAESSTERNICVTAADGQTGSLVADLLLSDRFAGSYKSLTLLALDPSKCQEFADKGAKVIKYAPGDVDLLVTNLKQVDTLLLVPPAVKDKLKQTEEMILAAKQAKCVNNMVLISSAGCDMAEKSKQPRLREFIEIETLFMDVSRCFSLNKETLFAS
jgi:uncharacterized protein YbjT (DUF2867 family)